MLANLRDRLHNWADFDGAEFEIGKALGVFSDDTKFSDVKGVLWSNNPVGNCLGKILNGLLEIGFLEENDEGMFRYNGGAWPSGLGNRF
jgi:hypothetical protein